MLTTIEAVIDVGGKVTLLEPITITKKSRAILTLLDAEGIKPHKILEQENQLAEERFARHFGAVNSGDRNSADNEKIDADLAKEYGATHDD